MGRTSRLVAIVAVLACASTAERPVLPPAPLAVATAVMTREETIRDREVGERIARALDLRPDKPGVWVGYWSDDVATGLPAIVRAITPPAHSGEPGVLYLFHSDIVRLSWIREYRYRPFRFFNVRFSQALPEDGLVAGTLFDCFIVLRWPKMPLRRFLTQVKRALRPSGRVAILLRDGKPRRGPLVAMAGQLGLEEAGDHELPHNMRLIVFSR